MWLGMGKTAQCQPLSLLRVWAACKRILWQHHTAQLPNYDMLTGSSVLVPWEEEGKRYIFTLLQNSCLTQQETCRNKNKGNTTTINIIIMK